MEYVTVRPIMVVKQDLRHAAWENPFREECCEHKKRMLNGWWKWHFRDKINLCYNGFQIWTGHINSVC